MAQNFKNGDALELKFQAVGETPIALCGSALDEFYADGFNASPFLLMLYDEGRMPFSDRIPRAAFVDFIKDALENFPITGIFEAYLFVLLNVFGTNSEIRFDVPAPGKLSIDIEANSNSEFDFIGREYVSGTYEYFEMTTLDEVDTLIFRGASGIETEYELDLLFAEVMPAGIVPDITLGFFVISDFAGDGDDLLVDDDDTGIIFVEGGA